MLRPLLIALLFAAPAATAANFYCCQDPVSNRRVCGDQVPEVCKGRSYKIFDGSGSLVREVGPPLTAEQRAAEEAEAKRKKAQEAAAREQRRKDAALLETYGSLQDLDKMLARSEEEILAAIRQAEAHITTVRQRRQKFENEAEFYKNRELPPDVARGLRDTDHEIQAQNSLIKSKRKDLEGIRAKFAEDRQRFLEILSGNRQSMHPAAALPGTSQSDQRPR